MSFWKKLFGASPTGAAAPPPSRTPSPSARSASDSPGPATDLVQQAQELIRRATGARDFLSRAFQAGWRKEREDSLGLFLRKGDAILVFGVLPSRGVDSIWNAMMTTPATGTVFLISEGKRDF